MRQLMRTKFRYRQVQQNETEYQLAICPRGTSTYPFTSHVDDLVELGWSSASPEDAFAYIFSFLKLVDLGGLASINKSWREAVYDPALWGKIDLSRMWWRVNDPLVIALLSHFRFQHVRFISLEGCLEITDRVVYWIADHCKDLKVLLLTDCCNITKQAILALVREVALDTLELKGVFIKDYEVRNFLHTRARNGRRIPGVRKHFLLARELRSIRPSLKMPLYWKTACAVSNYDLVAGGRVGLNRCRHVSAFGDVCLGRMRTRMIHSNTFYHRIGNYPREILYSCQIHRDQDFKDQDLYTCEICSCLFRRESMKSQLICNVCFDKETLREKRIWITNPNISLADVFSKSVKMANSVNLPHTLTTSGSIKFRLDYTIPEDEKVISRNEIPVDLFMSVNQAGTQRQLDLLKDNLKQAFTAGETRALLHINSQKDIEVLTDKHPVINGILGENFLNLSMVAWRNALLIIYPFLSVITVITIFVYLIKSHDSSSGWPTEYTGETAHNEAIQIKDILILSSIFVVLVFVGFFLAYQFREQCMKILKLFIFLDLLLLLLLGSWVILRMITSFIQLSLDTVSSMLFIWNFSGLGIFCLYNNVPFSLHRFYLATLFIVMAVMMVAVLKNSFVSVFVSIFALGDIITVFKPRLHILPNFILRYRHGMVRRTPRIIYPLKGITIRSTDMLWYGLVIGLVQPTPICLISVGVILIGSLCFTTFITPIFGYDSTIRPVSLATPFIILLIIISQMLIDFTYNHKFLHSTAITIPQCNVYMSQKKRYYPNCMN